jgi:hypothetical protein
MKKTLKTLALKTAKTNGVKPTVAADRTGLGFDLAAYPADSLSPRPIQGSHDPVPEQVPGDRQERPAEQMREQMRAVRATVGSSGRSAGCLSFPGSSAHRRPPSHTPPASGWQVWAKRTVAAGRSAIGSGSNSRSVSFPTVGGVGVASFPVTLGLPQNRLGRDCQSPDRGDDRGATTREARYATAAGK